MKYRLLEIVFVSILHSVAGTSFAQDCILPSALCSPTGAHHANKMCLEDDLAFLADGAWGMRIFDISDVTNPVLLSATTNPGASRDVAVVGNTAYLATSNDFRIFDVTDPSTPVLLGMYEPGISLAIAAMGNIVYTSIGSNLRAFDVSDPASLEPSSTVASSGGSIHSLTIDGDYIYAIGSNFDVYDISEPLTPVLVGSFDTPGGSSSVSIQGGLAYIASESNGVLVLDISNFNSINEINMFHTATNDVYEVAVSGSYAYIGVEYGGVHIYDVLYPEAPIFLGEYQPPSNSSYVTNAITFTGDSVVVATAARGIEIITAPNHCDECLADINGDGVARPSDFTSWISAFNSGSSACDQNGDRQCTSADFTAWIANFNAGCP
jgi:hypothetical protein